MVYNYSGCNHIVSNGKRTNCDGTEGNCCIIDNVNHPKHYTSHPSGVEHIDITKHYDFCVGNAIKYLWRSGLKEDIGRSAKEKEIEDLEKAIWYIKKKIEMLKDGV